MNCNTLMIFTKIQRFVYSWVDSVHRYILYIIMCFTFINIVLVNTLPGSRLWDVEEW